MALIELSEVCKTYEVGGQEIKALDRVNLIIEAGEFGAIIGPSGSGKSTLMHLLGCLDTPTSGSLRIDGTEIATASDDQLAEMRNRKIGFVFQSFNLLPRLDVFQNVELPMIYAGVSKKERQQKAEKAIHRVGLENRMHNRPMQLSGGQCQRVAIARALVNDPRIIFADEPTGALDSKTGASILALFCELSKQGCTIMLVTHDSDIAAVPPRCIEIRDGRIKADRGDGRALDEVAPFEPSDPMPA